MTAFSVCRPCQRSKGEAGDVGGDVHTALTLLGILTSTVTVRFARVNSLLFSQMPFPGSGVEGQTADASLGSQRKSHPERFIKMRSQLLGGNALCAGVRCAGETWH